MIQALLLSIGQLLDGRIALVFLKSMGLTALLFGGVCVGLYFGLHGLAARLLGTGADASTVADIATIVIGLFAAWLLFRIIAIAVIEVFADDVVDAVEARHYPEAHANVRRLPFHQSLRMGLGSAGHALLLNLLFSPVYLIALPAAPFVFFLVNSWLLGRDLGDMVAVRHIPVRDLPRWRRRSHFRRLTVGGIGTAMFLVPGLNLLAPVIGAAMATHAFHRARR
ncbi:MAG: EI24 domain-containing protein [Sphingomonas sp.]